MSYTTHLPDRHRNDPWKVPVRAASTANGTLATAFENGDTLDGVVLATGDRILLKNQSAGAENGVYTVNASGAPTRAADFDTQGDILAAVVVVTEGTVNADTMWLCTTNTPIVVGSTALVFASAGGGASGAAGGVLSGTYPNPGFAADMATQAELDAHTGDTSAAHAASAIGFTPNGSIAATDVQAAIQEVRDEAGSGGLPDHTHAATGSGANGGGNALDVNAGTLRVPVGTGALTTTEGHVGWQSTNEQFRLYDGQRERGIGHVGWATIAYPVGFSLASALTTAVALAANGGSVAVPMLVPAHFLFQSVTARSTDTATQRTWGWDLYLQDLNDGNAGENTVRRVAASTADETFTPGAASTRGIDAGSAPVYLSPGIYWLVVQCRHASNNFGLASTATGHAFGPDGPSQTKTTTNPNGATLDLVAATWTKNRNHFGVWLRGRVLGQTVQF